jgi:hypothetical protein
MSLSPHTGKRMAPYMKRMIPIILYMLARNRGRSYYLVRFCHWYVHSDVKWNDGLMDFFYSALGG